MKVATKFRFRIFQSVEHNAKVVRRILLGCMKYVNADTTRSTQRQCVEISTLLSLSQSAVHCRSHDYKEMTFVIIVEA